MSPSRIVSRYICYGNGEKISPERLRELIAAVDGWSIGNACFRPSACALNAVAGVVARQGDEPGIRAMFDAHADKLTRKAASWLSASRDGYSWAAEKFFERVLPVMDESQIKKAVAAMEERYDQLTNEQISLKRAIARDRYDNLSEEDKSLETRIKRFDDFLRRISPPAPCR